MLLASGSFLLLAICGGAALNVGDDCVVSHTKSRGVCALASKCQTARQDFQKNGISLTFCENSGNTLLVCCRDGFSTINNQRYNHGMAFNSFSSEEDTNRRISEKKCEEYSKRVVKRVSFMPLTLFPDVMSISVAECDYTGVDLIVGGEKADQGEFPHMAAIGWIDLYNKYAFQCGGSLISPRFVLTAGHCIKNPKMKDPNPAVVRLGDQNLDPKVWDGADPVDVAIKSIHKHPQYKPPGKYHDIALFELMVDVNFTADIRPACLWNKPDFPGYTKAIATGWGVVDAVTKQTTDELQKVLLSIQDNDYCDILLKNTRNRHWKGFINSQLCAGELLGGKDTCQGDSGSPLQVASKGNKCIFHVIGITSFGRRCAESGKPSVYTRVYSYLDWIESVVWPGEQ